MPARLIWICEANLALMAAVLLAHEQSRISGKQLAQQYQHPTISIVIAPRRCPPKQCHYPLWTMPFSSQTMRINLPANNALGQRERSSKQGPTGRQWQFRGKLDPVNLNGQHLNYPQLTSATSPNPHHIYSNSNTFKCFWDHLQIVGDIWQWNWRVFVCFIIFNFVFWREVDQTPSPGPVAIVVVSPLRNSWTVLWVWGTVGQLSSWGTVVTNFGLGFLPPPSQMLPLPPLNFGGVLRWEIPPGLENFKRSWLGSIWFAST